MKNIKEALDKLKNSGKAYILKRETRKPIKV